MWQGQLALKNDASTIQMHTLMGNRQLTKMALPAMETNQPLPILRIAQRMRLETLQLEGLARRMQVCTFKNI